MSKGDKKLLVIFLSGLLIFTIISGVGFCYKTSNTKTEVIEDHTEKSLFIEKLEFDTFEGKITWSGNIIYPDSVIAITNYYKGFTVMVSKEEFDKTYTISIFNDSGKENVKGYTQHFHKCNLSNKFLEEIKAQAKEFLPKGNLKTPAEYIMENN